MKNKQALHGRIRREFSFLVESFGFKETSLSEEPTLYDIVASYESDVFLLEIYIQPRDSEFEVGVNFCRKSNGLFEEKYAFHTYLALVNTAIYYKLGFSIAKSSNEVTELLEIYSNALQTDGLRILNSDKEAFNRMKEAVRTGKGLCRPYYMQPEHNRIISKYI